MIECGFFFAPLFGSASHGARHKRDWRDGLVGMAAAKVGSAGIDFVAEIFRTISDSPRQVRPHRSSFFFERVGGVTLLSVKP